MRRAAGGAATAGGSGRAAGTEHPEWGGGGRPAAGPDALLHIDSEHIFIYPTVKGANDNV